MSDSDYIWADFFIYEIISYTVDVVKKNSKNNGSTVISNPLSTELHKSFSGTHVIRQKIISYDNNDTEGASKELKKSMDGGWTRDDC